MFVHAYSWHYCFRASKLWKLLALHLLVARTGAFLSIEVGLWCLLFSLRSSKFTVSASGIMKSVIDFISIVVSFRFSFDYVRIKWLCKYFFIKLRSHMRNNKKKNYLWSTRAGKHVAKSVFLIKKNAVCKKFVKF